MVAFLHGFLAVSAACVGPRTPGDLRHALWADNAEYSRDTRPNVGSAAATGDEQPWAAPADRVEVGTWITYLSAVSPQTSTFTVEMTMETRWVDLRLRYNTTDNGGCFQSR